MSKDSQGWETTTRNTAGFLSRVGPFFFKPDEQVDVDKLTKAFGPATALVFALALGGYSAVVWF